MAYYKNQFFNIFIKYRSLNIINDYELIFEKKKLFFCSKITLKKFLIKF